jgi:hypothetical protein
MEPITCAIISALSSEFIKDSVKDTYEGLKAVIRRKWGESGPIKAISALEADPKSEAQAATVEETIIAAEANKDAEVLEALRQLLQELKTQGFGGDLAPKIQVNVNGGVVHGIAGAANVRIGSLSFRGSPKG